VGPATNPTTATTSAPACFHLNLHEVMEMVMATAAATDAAAATATTVDSAAAAAAAAAAVANNNAIERRDNAV